MDGKRQKNQRQLAFMNAPEGEAPRRVQQGAESFAAKRATKSPAREERLSVGIFERLTHPNRRGTDPYARWCGRGEP